MTVEAYPLCWPPGRPRTPAAKRTRAKFHAQARRHEQYGIRVDRKAITLSAAAAALQGELDRLKAARPVLSTNIRLRLDGLPYSGQAQPADPGAAVYFELGVGPQLCFACDLWDRVEDNVVAIAKTIEALRGIARWGTGDMVRAAFTGFAALPPSTPAKRAWWVVLGVTPGATGDEVEAAYSRLARENHPDRGGDTGRMAEINAAADDFRKERGLANG